MSPPGEELQTAVGCLSATIIRYNAIKTNLKRRDNIRAFVEGLEDTECWPYPEHQNGTSVAATYSYDGNEEHPILVKVSVRPEKIEELTCLYLINVKRALKPGLSAGTTLVDYAIELMPEDGPGAYTLDYEVVEDHQSREAAPTLSMEQVNDLRSAFMHRSEWVASKVHSVNLGRQDALDELLLDADDSDDEAVPDAFQRVWMDNEEPLSEEEDFVEKESDGYSDEEEEEQKYMKNHYDGQLDEQPVIQPYLNVHERIPKPDAPGISQSSTLKGLLPSPSAVALGCAPRPGGFIAASDFVRGLQAIPGMGFDSTESDDDAFTPPSKRSLSPPESFDHKRRRCNDIFEQAGAALAEFKHMSKEPPELHEQNHHGADEVGSSEVNWVKLGAAFTELASAMGSVVAALKMDE